MDWPIESDYFSSVQNPHIYFSDPELKAGEVTKNALGLPKSITGMFASVYQLNCPQSRRWAVRCFLRDIADQQTRYAAICAHLKGANLPYTVGFDYVTRGIRVNSNWYPILKMEWLDGLPLNIYIEQHLSRPQDIAALAKQWIDMTAAMRRAGVAHGDLQHGNILVCDGRFRLIDYDGMYVPALRGMHSNEEGHRNFQHPKRTGSDFGPELDNFSAWVIFISLSAFAIEPTLWQALNCGDENLLFRRIDFEHPQTSKVFRALENSSKPQLQSLGSHLRSLLCIPLSQIPSLDGVGVLPPPHKKVFGVPDWLTDHISEEKLESLHNDHPAPQRIISGADWIFDHLVDEKPVEPFLNTVPVGLERLVITAGIAVTLPMIFLAIYLTNSMAVSLASPFASSLILAGFLIVRYRALGTVEATNTLMSQIAEAYRIISQLDGVAQSINAERHATMQPLQELDQRYRTIPQRQSQTLRNVSVQLGEALAAIVMRRQKLDQAEAMELGDVDFRAQQARATLARQRIDQDRAEESERTSSLTRLRQNHIYNVLRSRPLTVQEVFGIGEKMKARLSAHGIHTAADIDHRIHAVPGIGPQKAAILTQWRRQIEWDASQVAPTSLPPVEEQGLRAKYRGQRYAIDQQLSASGDWQMKRRTEIVNNCIQLRQELLHAEETTKRDAEKQAEQVRLTFQLEKDQIAKTFQPMKARADATHVDLDKRASELSQSIFARRTELHHAQRELHRYRRITFGLYLRCVVGLRNA